MGLFNFFKKSPEPVKVMAGPYADSSTNIIYNLLFCDNIELYKSRVPQPYTYPFNILFSENSTIDMLQTVIDDTSIDVRTKVLAYNAQRNLGDKPIKKELLAVIVEVGLDNGLDVLASFKDGTARYINQTGKILVWETSDSVSSTLTKDLFVKGNAIIKQIGPWDKARLSAPLKGNVRITFLVSDGLYFGEGPIEVLFNDSMAGPTLTCATQLMQYLTQTALQNQ